MSDKNNDYIIKLMQNVSDRLDEISDEIGEIKLLSNEDKALSNQGENLEKIIQTQKIIYAKLNQSLEDIGVALDEKPSIINQSYKTEYILFGKDTPFSSKLLLSLLAVILICIPIFKYIPTYLNEKNSITQERDNYKLFYNYAFLNAFDKRKTVPTDLIETFSLIISKDSAFINYVEQLHSKYDTHLKKENLKAELQKLQE